MKVKFTTYLEIDLHAMSTQELNELYQNVERVLFGRRTTENPVITDVLRDVRALKAFETLFDRPTTAIKVSEIAEKMTQSKLLSVRTVGKKSISNVNNMLIAYGYSPLK